MARAVANVSSPTSTQPSRRPTSAPVLPSHVPMDSTNEEKSFRTTNGRTLWIKTLTINSHHTRLLFSTLCAVDVTSTAQWTSVTTPLHWKSRQFERFEYTNQIQQHNRFLYGRRHHPGRNIRTLETRRPSTQFHFNRLRKRMGVFRPDPPKYPGPRAPRQSPPPIHQRSSKNSNQMLSSRPLLPV